MTLEARLVSPTPPKGAWQGMLSGRRLDLLNPSPLDVEIEDIAHGLARVARWNGQTRGAHAFSVAQHSVLVERITSEISPRLARGARLMALLHDGPAYVVGDLISPFKAAVGIDYKDFELKLLSAIHLRFGLSAQTPTDLRVAIKKADAYAAYFEATQLAGFSAEEARRYFGNPPTALHRPKLVPLSTDDAQLLFLERFRRQSAHPPQQHHQVKPAPQHPLLQTP